MDIRKILNGQLKEAGRSRYWLARAQTVVNWRTAYRYLCGRCDTSGKVIGMMFDILGLWVHQGGRLLSEKKLQRRETKTQRRR